MTIESLAERTYELLKETDNPQLVLLRFYIELFDLKSEREDILFVSNLIKLYGKNRVFSAMLEAGAKKNSFRVISKEYVNGVIQSNCTGTFFGGVKKRNPSTDMTEFINERRKLAEESKAIKEELDE